MTPMDGGLSRPLSWKKARKVVAPPPRPPEKRPVSGPNILMAATVIAAVSLVVLPALWMHVKSRQPETLTGRELTRRTPAALTEVGRGWFDRADELGLRLPAPTASVPRVEPDRRLVRTRLIRANLRTVVVPERRPEEAQPVSLPEVEGGGSVMKTVREIPPPERRPGVE